VAASIFLSGCTDDSHTVKASFSIEPSMPGVNETVFFNSTSEDDENQIYLYKWYINGNFVSDGENLEYKFKKNGLYEVSLTITDENGQSDSCMSSLIVGQDDVAKQKLIGFWQWQGNNQIGNWTFYKNNTLKTVFTGIYPNGRYGSRKMVNWTYTVGNSIIYFYNPSDTRLDTAIYSYELLENDTLLRITYNNSTADWHKIS
jgi:PKD repeat protein